MSKIKKLILKNKITSTVSIWIHKYFIDYKLYIKTNRILSRIPKSDAVVFYLGIPAHRNLGDLAQGVCIRRWLKKNYPNMPIVEIETNALVNTHFSLLKKLKETYKSGDLIVFQSGYTTTDLGGFADEMHRAVMEILPNGKMLMMPQTIYFKSDENKRRTSLCYNTMKRMLFLARDRVSYSMALEMFPNVPVKQYPDIVTTLIGNYSFDYERNGILFCCRNDGEKFYSDTEINKLMKRCAELSEVEKTDTTKTGKTVDIVSHAKEHIDNEIDTYAHYKLIITDRYHGTILSLVAGTPVIIIKTTDHKVTTGAEWFREVYDDYVYLADSLEQAYEMAKTILEKPLDYKLQPYFENKYYDRLPTIFEQAVEG